VFCCERVLPLLGNEVRELQVQVVQICGIKEKRSLTLVTN